MSNEGRESSVEGEPVCWTEGPLSSSVGVVSTVHVRVYVTPKQGILDPQGVTIERALPALGFDGVSGVRVGKFIELDVEVDGGSPDAVKAEVDEMCRKLLANPIIEDFTFTIDEA